MENSEGKVGPEYKMTQRQLVPQEGVMHSKMIGLKTSFIFAKKDRTYHATHKGGEDKLHTLTPHGVYTLHERQSWQGESSNKGLIQSAAGT